MRERHPPRRPASAFWRRTPRRGAGRAGARWPPLLVAVVLLWYPVHTSGCWEKIHNPFIESDAGLKEYLCGSCNWVCIGDTCGASDCNDEDYDGDGLPDCRCDLCGEEVPNTVFNSDTCRCESQIIDADGNIISSAGVQEPVCIGIEEDTNYVGGDCACYADDPFVSYDGTHLQSIPDADTCVYACQSYSMPYYVFRGNSQQCWCKSEDGYNNPVEIVGSIAGNVEIYLANCAEPLPVPMSGEVKALIGVGCVLAVVLGFIIWWVVRAEKTGTFCCC